MHSVSQEKKKNDILIRQWLERSVCAFISNIGLPKLDTKIKNSDISLRELHTKLHTGKGFARNINIATAEYFLSQILLPYLNIC